MTDLQVRALMSQAYPASWHSLLRSERVLSSAIELNRLQTDPVVRSITQANCHFWRLWLGGWNDESAAIYRECGVTIEASADRCSVAWYRVVQALIWFMSSRYRASREQIVVLNWCWRIAAEWALAQLWIARPDLDRASHHANEMLALSAHRPEATWRALALETGHGLRLASVT
jgi:hypothetical protein